MKFSSFPSKIKTFGNSMLPILQDQDVVFLRKKKFANIKVNDIICARKNKKVFTHRVIYRTDKYLITAGDNNRTSDGRIYPRNLIGEVHKVKRGSTVFDIENLYLIQSTMYFNEIVKVKKAFEKNNIEYVILKGLPVYLYLEDNHPKRIYADCDILIDKKMKKSVEKVLLSCGYLPVNSSVYKLVKQGKNIPETSYFKKLNGFYVIFDIHSEVVFMMTQIDNLDCFYPKSKVNMLSRDFLEEKKNIVIRGVQFPILSETNLFVYLCLHFFHHNFKGAYRAELISRLLQEYKMNFEEIYSKIDNYKLKGFIYPTLLFLERYYITVFPKRFIEQVKPVTNLKFIKNYILKSDIFSEEGRVKEGMRRFFLLFKLSPESTYKKIQAIVNPQVIYLSGWVMYKKFR